MCRVLPPTFRLRSRQALSKVAKGGAAVVGAVSERSKTKAGRIIPLTDYSLHGILLTCCGL